jgi:hypothetical protein
VEQRADLSSRVSHCLTELDKQISCVLFIVLITLIIIVIPHIIGKGAELLLDECGWVRVEIGKD